LIRLVQGKRRRRYEMILEYRCATCKQLALNQMLASELFNLLR
jgi:hypothetical protein